MKSAGALTSSTLVALISLGLAQTVAQSRSAPEQSSRRISVVVSAENPVDSIEISEVRRIFLRERTMWSRDLPISVFERPASSPIRQAFSAAVLRRSPANLAEYWLNLSLTRGLSPPKVSGTTPLLLHYLRGVRGGVGYMYDDEVVHGLRVIAVVREEGK